MLLLYKHTRMESVTLHICTQGQQYVCMCVSQCIYTMQHIQHICISLRDCDLLTLLLFTHFSCIFPPSFLPPLLPLPPALLLEPVTKAIYISTISYTSLILVQLIQLNKYLSTMVRQLLEIQQHIFSLFVSSPSQFIIDQPAPIKANERNEGIYKRYTENK